MSTPDRRDMHFEPGKLWSLWNLMRQIPIAELMRLDVYLSTEIARYDHARAPIPIGAAAVVSIKGVLDMFETLGATPDFAAETYGLVAKMRHELNPGLLNGSAHAYLASIHEVFQSELSKKGCFLLDREEMAYADQAALFGTSVADAFPSAAMDIREAGNCFAAGRYNASAYHCVQAAEIGLRALARDRRVDFSGWTKPTPLEHAQWGNLIGELERKIEKIKGWDNGPVKEAAYQFYDRALLDLVAINDGWRRHLSHARSHQYHRDDVVGLMSNVRRVMQSLARRLGEKRSPTPVTWKRVPPELLT